MVKEKLLKIMLVIIMGVALIGMATNVFALTDDDLYLDLNAPGDTNTNTDLNTNTNVNTNTNTNINTSLNTTNNTTSNYNTNLPKAGVAENTILGVGITLLAISSIYAYRKVKDYKDI